MAEDRARFIPAGYTLVSKLGSGRTANVYLARHTQRGQVALKLPRDELAREPLLRRMFENEVQMTLGLQHPHLVAAFDGAPTGRGAFLALEYCPGDTLAQSLRSGGQLPLARARQLIVDVARGLEYAHGRRVLHRDVKPANVFLTSAGQAKLGDFGTGLHIGQQGGSMAMSGSRDSGMERVGTAYYMAPEVFEGQAASIRSDVYSLGILAYEVLAGMRPFTGDSYEDLMMAHLSSLPRALTHHRTDLSSSEVKVVATAMARNSRQRYGSIREFREAFMIAAGLPDEPVEPQQQLTGRASRKSADSARKAPDEGGKPKTKPGLLDWFKRKREE